MVYKVTTIAAAWIRVAVVLAADSVTVAADSNGPRRL